MSYLHDRVYDNGLGVFAAEANRNDICSQEPATYTEATSTYTKANKTGFAVGSPAARTPNGRKVTTGAITNGSVTASATGSHWAISDTTNSRLLAAAALSASQALVSGNTYSLPAFDIGIPAPA